MEIPRETGRGATAAATRRFRGGGWNETGARRYLVVWKAWATRCRQKTLGTYFGYPVMVWFLMWLLYATFNDKRSTGDMEQYLAALSFVFVLQGTASALAADKALKLRESLRAMGLRDAARVRRADLPSTNRGAAAAVDIPVETSRGDAADVTWDIPAETSRGDAADVDRPWRRVARLRRGYSDGDASRRRG